MSWIIANLLSGINLIFWGKPSLRKKVGGEVKDSVR
jgi:hypothetical protein